VVNNVFNFLTDKLQVRMIRAYVLQLACDTGFTAFENDGRLVKPEQELYLFPQLKRSSKNMMDNETLLSYT
jgi:hypothetical protein